MRPEACARRFALIQWSQNNIIHRLCRSLRSTDLPLFRDAIGPEGTPGG